MLCEVKAGNGVEVTVTFKDKDGALADPTTASIVKGVGTGSVTAVEEDFVLATDTVA